jgi:hypothetical protein
MPAEAVFVAKFLGRVAALNLHQKPDHLLVLKTRFPHVRSLCGCGLYATSSDAEIGDQVKLSCPSTAAVVDFRAAPIKTRPNQTKIALNSDATVIFVRFGVYQLGSWYGGSTTV